MKKWLAENRHALLLLYLPFYMLVFFVIERIPAQYHIIRCPLDQLIPFNQYMILPYCLWFPWFPGWLLWFLIKDRDEFIRLALVMFTGMSVSLLIYLFWPNGIDLREEITGADFCSQLVRLTRILDTPYGVCPSIHVSTITAIALSVHGSRLREQGSPMRLLVYAVTLLISWSTMAIKQHSIVDVTAGALLSLVLYLIIDRLLKQKHETVH